MAQQQATLTEGQLLKHSKSLAVASKLTRATTGLSLQYVSHTYGTLVLFNVFIVALTTGQELQEV
jgi:hypothetical protein